LLLKTSNSALWSKKKSVFHENYVALTLDGAEWLVQKRIGLVGIDYLSIQRYRDSNETHRALLNAGILVLEGLDLSEAEEGSYELVCLPLPIVDAEGAPARAILRNSEQ